MAARKGMAGGAGGGGRRTPTPDGVTTADIPGVAGTDDAGMCCALASGASAAQHTRQRTAARPTQSRDTHPGAHLQRAERAQPSATGCAARRGDLSAAWQRAERSGAQKGRQADSGHTARIYSGAKRSAAKRAARA